MAAAGRMLVFGGRGFVGASVCRELARRGITPTLSLGRSAESAGGPVCATVEQKTGVDALTPESYSNLLEGARAVVISIGLPPWILNREKAVRANGLTNATVLKAAMDHKVPRVVLVNATMPSWGIIAPYREGKLMAEAQAIEYAEKCGPDCGVLILKPGVVSGTRYVGSLPLPLWLAFAPMRFIFSTFAAPCQALEKMLPSLLGGCLRPAVYADELATAAADAIEDPDFRGVRILGPEVLAGYRAKDSKL